MSLNLILFYEKDQLKSKEDVPVTEAFELYMLKKFHGIKLNSVSLINIPLAFFLITFFPILVVTNNGIVFLSEE